MKYLDEMENQLAHVYHSGYKGQIEFEFGQNPLTNVFELFLFHRNNKFLIEATKEIKFSLTPILGDRWVIYCEK